MCFNVAYILFVSLLFFYTVCLVIFHPGLFPGEALDSELVRGDPHQTTKPNHQTTTMEEPWETVLLRFREYIRDAMVASRRFLFKLLCANHIEVIASQHFVFKFVRASHSRREARTRDALVATRRFVFKLLRASLIEAVASRHFVFEPHRASHSCRDAMVASRRSRETLFCGVWDASVTQ